VRAISWPIALVLATGCASPRQIVLGPGPDERLELRTILAGNPIGPGEALKAVPLKRTESSSLTLVQIRTREEPHSHAAHDLTVTVLDGKGKMFLISPGFKDGATSYTGSLRRLREGDTVLIRRNTIHWFINGGKKPAVALANFSPPLDSADSIPSAPAKTVEQYLDSMGLPVDEMDLRTITNPDDPGHPGFELNTTGRSNR